MGDFLIEKRKKIKIDFCILFVLLILLFFVSKKYIDLISDLSFSAKQIKKITIKSEKFIFKENKYFLVFYIYNSSNFPIFITYYDIFYKVNVKNGNIFNGRVRNFNVFHTIDSGKDDHLYIELNDMKKNLNIENIHFKGSISIETNPTVSKYKINYTFNENLNLIYY
ncbi:MAG: hypothetical protein N3A58_03005 [Spirochaetes bacterium]|nr:hypothetical protein [Spirochaetota bacterium]